MNKLINIVLSGLLWRRYKFLIISIMVLIAAVFIISKVHEDYLAYSQTTDAVSAVGYSFIIKWIAWSLCFIGFFAANHIANKNKEKQDIAQTHNKTLKTLINDKLSKFKPSSDTQHSVGSKKTEETFTSESSASGGDPFLQLRDKPKLRSYADLLIEKNKKHK